MPYSKFIAGVMTSKSRVCYCCGMPFTRLDQKAIHSMTGFHYEAVCLSKPEPHYMLIARDVPLEYGYMLGHVCEDLLEFGIPFSMDGDAVCLCVPCHKRVHKLALELSRDRNPDFKGNTPTPRNLVDATRNYHKYKKIPTFW